MNFRTEFNKGNYPNVFIDYKPRKGLGSHYCVDTAIVLGAIGQVSYLKDYKSLSEYLIYKWCVEHRITLPQPVITEIYGKLELFNTGYKCETFRKMLRKFLNRPNFRFILKDPITNKLKEMTNDPDYRKVFSETWLELRSVKDAEIHATAHFENAEVVTADKGLDEMCFRLGTRSHCVLIEKLPKDFVGDWTSLKKELILKV